MPFELSFTDIYVSVISKAITQAGLKPLRADEIFSPGPIIEQIRSGIQQSRVCIADITGRNPNVLYELGIAQALGKPTILLSQDQDMDDVPFDVSHLRIIVYNPKHLSGREHLTRDLLASLNHVLGQVLGDDRLEEARQLIQAGMFRASVAMLGVLLEHSLRTLIQRYAFNLQMTDIDQRTMTMGKMIQILSNAKVIKVKDAVILRDMISIRNRAVHDLMEPTRSQAETFFKFMEVFIEKYMKEI